MNINFTFQFIVNFGHKCMLIIVQIWIRLFWRTWLMKNLVSTKGILNIWHFFELMLFLVDY